MSVTTANRTTKPGGELALSPPDQRLPFRRLLHRHCIEPLAQTAAAIALGGTGGCVPSNIQANVPVILGGTGGCVPSSIRANTAIILGGTGGCVPSKNAALGGTGGCVPSSIAVNVLWEDKLPGTRLAAKPRITSRNTTALAVGFIAISSFWFQARLSALRPYRGGAARASRGAKCLECKAGIAAIRKSGGKYRHNQERLIASSPPWRERLARSYCGPQQVITVVTKPLCRYHNGTP